MIADGELLPQQASSTQPQYLAICETITDDLPGFYDFAAGSEIVFLRNSSRLEVNNNATLRFFASYLHGCEKLWDRILVKSGGRLILAPGCRVEDATRAVHLEPGVDLLIASGCTFDGNYISIYAGGPGSPNQHSVLAAISRCTFSGQKALLEPLPGNTCVIRPVYGIYLENVRFLMVGGTGEVNTNSFRDFGNPWACSSTPPFGPTGIFSSNSNLNVRNSNFKNFGGSSNRGVDFLVSSGSVSTLNLIGLGQFGSPTFDSLQTGVYGFGNVNVSSSRFTRCLDHAVYLQGPSNPYTSKLANNSFDKIRDHTVLFDWGGPINRFEVRSCRFDDNGQNEPVDAPVPFFSRTGVFVRSFKPGFQSSGIFNNTFLNSLKSAPFYSHYRGVWINNLNGVIIQNNQFSSTFSSTTNAYQGVYLYRAPARVWSNSLTGAGNLTNPPSAAVHVEEAPGTWLNCNTTDQTEWGFNFRGYSDGSTVERNHFNTHHTGLRMEYDAVIGEQRNKLNRWIGNSSVYEALFVGRNPYIQNDALFIAQSLFRIHTPDMSTDYWPDPRVIGSVADPGVWFVEGEPNSVSCVYADTTQQGGGEAPDPEPHLTEVGMRVIAGTFQPVKGYPAGVWEVQLHLYNYLSEHPQLRPEGSDAAQWYAAMQGTTVGILGDVYQGILSLSRYTAEEREALDEALAAQQAAAEAVADKDGEIAASYDNLAALEALLDERQELDAALGEAIAAHQALVNSWRSVRVAAAQQLLQQVNAVSTTEAFETDFKEVCRILLETYLSEGGLSDTNRATLQAIAQQCRYLGGFAVVQARASLGGEASWEQYDDCPDAPEERTAASAERAVLSLYPNPSKGVAMLDAGRTVMWGRVILRDLSGRPLQEWSLDGQRQLWLRWPSALPAGLYLLEVRADRAAPQVLKVAIEHH